MNSADITGLQSGQTYLFRVYGVTVNDLTSQTFTSTNATVSKSNCCLMQCTIYALLFSGFPRSWKILEKSGPGKLWKSHGK